MREKLNASIQKSRISLRQQEKKPKKAKRPEGMEGEEVEGEDGDEYQDGMDDMDGLGEDSPQQRTKGQDWVQTTNSDSKLPQLP